MKFGLGVTANQVIDLFSSREVFQQLRNLNDLSIEMNCSPDVDKLETVMCGIQELLQLTSINSTGSLKLVINVGYEDEYEMDDEPIIEFINRLTCFLQTHIDSRIALDLCKYNHGDSYSDLLYYSLMDCFPKMVDFNFPFPTSIDLPAPPDRISDWIDGFRMLHELKVSIESRLDLPSLYPFNISSESLINLTLDHITYEPPNYAFTLETYPH
ncbi:unnamed protein product [Ambrosiozyma monospora]|uniref:Unnamed protein product n=1 Tax=Ambrosiozyma monospora TaxID=43982 RepID=A0ACB5T707_AMBMO|nr:unnamed protein product [Ambrosiozyma monospora]